MSNLETAEKLVLELPLEERKRFREWFSKFDGEVLDSQLSARATTGKLDSSAPDPSPDHSIDATTGKDVKEALSALLYETFEKGFVSYLEEGSSLLETLNSLTVAEASVPISETGVSIASHTAHVRFYLKNTIQTLRGFEEGDADWEESWRLQSVSEEQWASLLKTLQESYGELQSLIQSFDTEESARGVWGSIAVIAHSAYHLGAIRLALKRK